MHVIDRRGFLVRSGLALSATLLSSEGFPPKISAFEPANPPDWQSVRDQFPLSRDLIHLAGFSSPPTRRRYVRPSNDTVPDWTPIQSAIGSLKKTGGAVLQRRPPTY